MGNLISLLVRLIVPVIILGSIGSEILKAVKNKKGTTADGDNVIDLNMTRDQQKKLSGFGKVGMVVVLALAVVLNGIYTLDETEDAVITTFGVPAIEEGSGLHFKIPFVQKIKKVSTETQGMRIGYDEYDNTIENEALMITKDFNFINVDFYLEWQVVDPVAFVYAAEEPVTMLKTLAMSYIRDTIGSYGVDEVLTTGKAQIQAEIKEKLTKRMEAEAIGVAVRNVSIQDCDPPTAEVVRAFKAVEDAKQNAETAVYNATADKNKRILNAEAEANQILENAQAEKTARIKEAEGEVAKFNAMYEEYIKFPEITKERMYYETMENLLPEVKVIIQDDSGKVVNVLQGE
ncbi:MAG: FtsH protease activity modulator HflK [Oscillospiraceae bacterium]|nr:FtsH protease activity modulator HflK [Oscillospiraceae bacterium]